MNEPARERPPGFDEAVERYLAQLRTSQPIDARTFAARHAELGPELLDALEAVEALEAVHAQDVARIADAELGRVGPFRLLREIGRGGMGVVFEAVEEPLERRVALKVLPAELLSSAQARTRFRREAELASRIEHSSICTVYGAGVDDGRPWIAMRFVDGETLARRIARARESGADDLELPGAGRDARARAVALAGRIARIARALQIAHEHGVVHRDVKPSNVMIDAEGLPVLLDFGLAREEASDASGLTRTGETAGTPAYIAPELIAGEIERVDSLGDVYALGVTLYECLTLRRPFESPTRDGLYREILSAHVRDVRAQNTSIPRDLSVVVATAIERDRSRRYASASALAADLEAVVAGKPIAARPVPAIGRALRWMRREPRQAVLAGLLCAAVIGLAVASGIVWASRPDVLAAANLAREHVIEHELETGFLELAAANAAGAEASFDRVLAIDPSNLEAIGGRTFVSLARHRDDEARARLVSAPDTQAFAVLRAMAAGGLPVPEDDPERLAHASALELFLEGRGLLVQAKRSPALQRQALGKRALERLNEAVVRSTSARPLYHSERAFAARDAGDSTAAHSAAAALVMLWPDSAYAHAAAGFALYPFDATTGRVELERAIELDGRWASTWRSLANACIQVGDWDSAERAVRRAVELDPSDAISLGTLGSVLVKRGCTEEAVAALQKALDLSPGRFELVANLGMLELQLGEDALAELHLRQALAIDWYQSTLHESLAVLLHLQRSWPESRVEYEVAVAMRPTSVRALQGLALVLLELGENADALRMFDAALERQRQDPGLLVNKSIALTRLGRDLESDELLQQVQRIAPDTPDVARMRGERLLKAGDVGGAMIQFTRAIGEDALDSDAWSGLARANDELGQQARAQVCFERALELDACQADANFGMAELLAARGSVRACADQLAHAAEVEPAGALAALRRCRRRVQDPDAFEPELRRAAAAHEDLRFALNVAGED